MTCYNLVEDIVQIPKERIFINDIVLDEELQLERELYWEEMAPIDAAWANILPRATWSQALPMAVIPAHEIKRANLTALQAQFIATLVWQGEMGAGGALALAAHARFQSAFDALKEKAEHQGCSVDYLIGAANLMSELRAVA